MHDVQLAEDATQQALLNMWRHLPDLRDATRFEAWSYQLLVKACYSESRRRRHWRLDVGLGRTDRPATSGDISNVIDRDQLERGLGRISLDHRTVLVLRYYLRHGGTPSIPPSGCRQLAIARSAPSSTSAASAEIVSTG